MSLLKRLQAGASTLTPYNGNTPATPIGATDQSKLHYTYSLNGIPAPAGETQPSQLDLDGITPPKYTENLPG
jgi:hypothetical protein